MRRGLTLPMFGSSFILSVMSVMKPAFMKSGMKMRSIDSMSGTSPAAAAAANFVTICGLGMTVSWILLSWPEFQASTIFLVSSSPSLRTHMLRVVPAMTGADAAIISDATTPLASCRMTFRRRVLPLDARPQDAQNGKAEHGRKPLHHLHRLILFRGYVFTFRSGVGVAIKFSGRGSSSWGQDDANGRDSQQNCGSLVRGLLKLSRNVLE
jgi:hypothetical protein